MKCYKLILAVCLLSLAACGQQSHSLSRMECVVDGRTVATISFVNQDGRLEEAQVFDRNKQWLFTVTPRYNGGKLEEVVYSSSDSSQRAKYASPTADSLLAMFIGSGDFLSNEMRLDKHDRVVERRLRFRGSNLQYHLNIGWLDELPQHISYTYSNSNVAQAVEHGGELAYVIENDRIARIEVHDDALERQGEAQIICHYAPSSGGAHDWSEKALYLPSPMLLLTAWSVQTARESQ